MGPDGDAEGCPCGDGLVVFSLGKGGGEGHTGYVVFGGADQGGELDDVDHADTVRLDQSWMWRVAFAYKAPSRNIPAKANFVPKSNCLFQRSGTGIV